MTKDDFVWVLIRGLGFLLVLQALISAKDIVSALAELHYGPSGKTDFGQAFMETARSSIVAGAISGLFYFAIGLYLLRAGNWVFRLLTHVRPKALYRDAC